MYVYPTVAKESIMSFTLSCKLVPLLIIFITNPSTIYCKLFEVEKFRGFHGSIDNCKTFPVKDSMAKACAIGFGHIRLLSNCKCFPISYSLVLHTTKLFHLKCCGIYEVTKFSTLINPFQYSIPVFHSTIPFQLFSTAGDDGHNYCDCN